MLIETSSKGQRVTLASPLQYIGPWMGFMCDCAGSMREIDVIDVARQQDGKMLMRDWTEYYNSQHRRKIYNVISLEFTNTK